jgi:hypothetical protein
MNEGWKCPVCGKGVAPTEKHCDHGAPSINTSPSIHWQRDCDCPLGQCRSTVCPRKQYTISPLSLVGGLVGTRAHEQTN